VLALATWNVSQEECASASAAPEGEARVRAVRELRVRLGIPRHVSLVEADMVLPLDLEAALSIDGFVEKLARAKSGVMLQESYPGPDGLCVSGPEGLFANELLVPFVRSAAPPAPAVITAKPPAPLERFDPGSEWLYAKLYMGPAAADQALREFIGPAVRRLLEDGRADRFFFVRYSDEEGTHLRLRLHGEPSELLGCAVPRLAALAEQLREQRMLHKWSLDSYARETNRYGGADTIEAAEGLFAADSLFALDLLEGFGPGDVRNKMVAAALWSVPALFKDLDMDAAQAGSCLGPYAANLRRTLKIADAAPDRLSPMLDAVAVAKHLTADDRGVLSAAIAARSRAASEYAHALRMAREEGRLCRPYSEVALALLHMHINRLLRHHQPQHECAIVTALTDPARYAGV
jgi:thiopeptide-type bacteriocin biosynthesis protein